MSSSVSSFVSSFSSCASPSLSFSSSFFSPAPASGAFSSGSMMMCVAGTRRCGVFPLSSSSSSNLTHTSSAAPRSVFVRDGSFEMTAL